MEKTIKKYIEQNIEDLKGKMYPVFTTDLSGMSIAYKTTPISGGHVKQSQIELKIIGEDYDDCKEMEERIKDLLDMEEDAPFITYEGMRFRSELGGGGILFNNGCNRYENTLFFIITWRK